MFLQTQIVFGAAFDAARLEAIRPMADDTPLTFTSITRENSSAGTFQSGALRLIVAALFTSRSGGPPLRTLFAHALTSKSWVTSTTLKPLGDG